MVPLVDTHVHLDSNRFDEDRQELLDRAGSVGVRQLVTIGTNVHTSRAALVLGREREGIWSTVGLHPHEARTGSEETYRTFRELARESSVVGVGEQGLDFYYDNSPREEQRDSFRAQLRLAIELDLPAVIHVRDAYEDAWDIIVEEWLDDAGRPNGPGGVFHCFAADVDFAQRCVEAGFMLGIGGVVTFSNAQKLHRVVEDIGLEHLVLETDAPYLTPDPHRGKRNEPAYIPHIAERVADLKGITVKRVAEQTTANARRLFQLPDSELLPAD
jgi:TatD DNase family protein